MARKKNKRMRLKRQKTLLALQKQNLVCAKCVLGKGEENGWKKEGRKENALEISSACNGKRK
jgi:hypothetical protein